jgi:hypothetical protein
MSRWAYASALVVLIAVVPQAAAQANFTGTWTGDYVGVSTGCDPDVRHGGTATASMSQSGSSVNGTFTAQRFVDNCRASAPQQPSIPFSGTVSGNTMTAGFPGGSFTAQLNGDEITATIIVGDTTSEALLVRTGAAPAAIAGRWGASVQAVATFCTPPTQQVAQVTMDIVQNSGSFTGSMILTVVNFNCQPAGPRVFSIPISGTVVGRTFNGTFDATPVLAPGPPGAPGTFSGWVSGNTLTVAFSAGDTLGTGTATYLGRIPRQRAVRR